jgi:hypothetical protein
VESFIEFKRRQEDDGSESDSGESEDEDV